MTQTIIQPMTTGQPHIRDVEKSKGFITNTRLTEAHVAMEQCKTAGFVHVEMRDAVDLDRKPLMDYCSIWTTPEERADKTKMDALVNIWKGADDSPQALVTGTANFFEVIVGNVGKVHEGNNGFHARVAYNQARSRSMRGGGREAGESVDLYRNGEILLQHTGKLHDGD